MTQQIKNEIAVLLSMMSSDDLMNIGLADLVTDCFTNQETARVFPLLRDIHAQNRQATLENTRFSAEFYDLGMREGILEPAAFQSTILELQNGKNCRNIIAIADMMRGIAIGGNFSKALDYCVAQIGKMRVDEGLLSFVSWQTAAKLAEIRITKMRQPGGKEMYFIPSGYKEIDAMYMGLPLELIIIAADSGEGKSTVVLPIILANTDKEIFVASTEVSPAGLSANLSAIKADLFRSDIHRGKIDDKQTLEYINVLETIIAKMKGGVTMNRKLSRIVSEMKIWRMATDITVPGIVIVDFLTDIFDDHGNTFADDKLIRNAISILNGLSKELNVAMIVLVQFNQLRKGRTNKRPNRGDIYGSASVYQSAYVVIYPFRPCMFLKPEEKHYYDKMRYEDAYLIIDKYKENGCKDIPVVFDKYVTQFLDVEMRKVRTFNGEQMQPVLASNLNADWEVKQQQLKNATK